MWAADVYRSAREHIQVTPALSTVSMLMLLSTAFHGLRGWFFVYPARVLVIAGLIFRPLPSSGWFWLGLAGLASIRVVYLWHDIDNNGFIYLYWLWILVIAHFVSDAGLKERIVVSNARFFLIFIMLLAVFKKATSGTYLDASFFEAMMLTDTRFRGFLALFGVDPTIMAKGAKALTLLKNPFVSVADNAIFLPTTQRIHNLALFVTWYDLLIQALIGMAFLVRRHVSDLIGHIALLAFIFTAYFAAPVTAFSWLLAIMGFVLAKQRFPNVAMIYLLSFGVMTLYEIPWQRWVI